MLLLALAFPVSICVAMYLGLLAGRQDPQTMHDFAKVGGYYFLWAVTLVLMWHILWIASLVPAHWQDTLRSAVEWTLGTGAIWVPIFGITYVLQALKERR